MHRNLWFDNDVCVRSGCDGGGPGIVQVHDGAIDKVYLVFMCVCVLYRTDSCCGLAKSHDFVRIPQRARVQSIDRLVGWLIDGGWLVC